MAQAEGTSKNEGRVSPSTSGASKGSSSSSKSSSSSGSKSSSSSSKSSSFGGFSSSGFGSALSGIGKALGSTFGNASSGAMKAASSFSSGVNKATNISSSKSATAKKDSLGTSVSKAFSGFTDSLSRTGDNALKGFGGTLNTLSKAVVDNVKTDKRDFGGFGGNAAVIAGVFQQAGWSNSRIHAALGSLQQESGNNFNPLGVNKGDAKDGTDSVGIGQWNMDRLTGPNGLYSFAEKRNKDWRDVKTQAEFMVHELNTNKKNVSRQLDDAEGDVKEQARIFGQKYEVSKQIPERQNYALGWQKVADNLGIEDITGFDREIKGSIASIENLGKPVGEKPSQYNSDPFGLGQVVANALGLESPNTGKQKSGGYVDPMVSSVEGRQARGEPDTGTSRGRTGIAGVVDKASRGKGVGAAVDVAKAISNPVEFALSTVMDFGRQTRGMNTPGPEGVGGDYSQNGFGLGFLQGLFGDSGDGQPGGFAASEKGGGRGQSFETAQATQGIAAPEDAPALSNPVFTPVTPLTPPALNPPRKPFGWSLL